MKKYFIAIGAIIGMVLMFLLKLLEGPKIKVKTTHKTVDRSKNVDRSKTKVKGKKNAVKDVEDIDIEEEPKKKKKKFRLFGKKKRK